jgi:hypothetical protein
MPRSDRPEDPRGLIHEAYRIEGIGEMDCRTIFFDWALGVPETEDMVTLLRALHAHYAPLHPDHPMSAVLAEGLQSGPPRRRHRRAR